MSTIIFFVAVFLCSANAEIVDCSAENRISQVTNGFLVTTDTDTETELEDTDEYQIHSNNLCTCDPAFAGELCYLDCAEEDKCRNTVLQCRSNDICIIDCSAEDSCDGNTVILASTATDVTVVCGDDDSCNGNVEIFCGTGHCQIFCGDDDSCENAIIHSETASSFVCAPAINCAFAGSDTSVNVGQIIPRATTDESETETTELLFDIFTSDALQSQMLPFAKIKDDRSSSSNTSNFVISIVGILSLMTIMILFVGLGYQIRKSILSKHVISAEFARNYGAL